MARKMVEIPTPTLKSNSMCNLEGEERRRDEMGVGARYVGVWRCWRASSVLARTAGIGIGHPIPHSHTSTILILLVLMNDPIGPIPIGGGAGFHFFVL